MKSRSLPKRLVHGAGLLGLLHRARNGRTLTVVAFHRVLPRDDKRWAEADPAWTVSRELFGAALDFFRRHYRVVGAEELLAARREGHQLPDRSLCVTLDDGWADTAEHALPELARRDMPAIVFVSSGAIGRSEPFWREALEAARRAGRLSRRTLRELSYTARGTGVDPPEQPDAEGVRRLVELLETAEPAVRREAVARCEELRTASGHDLMLSPAQVRELEAGGLTVGSHGETHEPLDLVRDPAAELTRSRQALAFVLGHHPMAGPLALSFPHGRYWPEHLALADQVGYQLLFTSDPHLVRLDGDGLPDVLGRIPIDGRQVCAPDGRLAPELLALWLFRRPRHAVRQR